MKPTPNRALETLAGLVGLLTSTAGLWAMTAPGSFYRLVAPFPPYNNHLIHDIGAFQIGLGGCLVAGVFLTDALLAVLVGNTLAGTAHFVSHVLDRAEGGHAGDPATIGALALVLAVLTIARWATTRTGRRPARATVEAVATVDSKDPA